MDKILEVKQLNKYYGSNHVLKDISFDMEQGEVIAIIGSSGGGKTTLLRSLTFLERIQKGTIDIAGESIVREEQYIEKPKKYIWVNKETKQENEEVGETKLTILDKLKSKFAITKKLVKNPITEPFESVKSVYPSEDELREKRLKMGLVFQDFNLFPHKTVLENLILAPMLVKGKTREEAEELARTQLEKVGLGDKADSYPCNISGGQKQRVAIARALCMQPEILCFDEPTSALDPELTGEVLKVISELRDSGVTMLIVTHEIMFAREVADKVIFLDGGVILEMGNAKEVIDNPQMDRTKAFMDKILKA